MHPDTTALRIDVLDSFTTMLESINTLCRLIRQDTALPAWVSRTESEVAQTLNMREKAIHLYHALWYEDGQDGRETVTCPGIVGATVQTLAGAQACNIAKDRFKSAILALKSLARPQATAIMSELYRRNEQVAKTMNRMGAARLNLKQAYRHVPILDVHPLKIGFTWSKQGRTIQRTAVAEAQRLLERRSETPQTKLELQRLGQIPSSEMLARVRSVCPHLRANIVSRDAATGVKRRLMQAPLPILVPLQHGEPLPDFVPIAPTPVGGQRLQRSDVRIEEEPFLPSIRVHRYRQPYR